MTSTNSTLSLIGHDYHRNCNSINHSMELWGASVFLWCTHDIKYPSCNEMVSPSQMDSTSKVSEAS